MARSDSFLKKWASVPSQFERPSDALIDRGWAGGAAEDPPEAKWENWWHNRVDEALAEIESNGAMQWFDDVPYKVGASSRDEERNWIAVIPSTGIKPGSAEDVGHWAPVGAYASETLLGILRVGTQPEVDAGTLDDVVVTPKKLRFGFAASFGSGANYVAFPEWLGSWAIQWGLSTVQTTGTTRVDFPIAFNAKPGLILTGDGDGGDRVTIGQNNNLSESGFDWTNIASIQKGVNAVNPETLSNCYYLVIGKVG